MASLPVYFCFSGDGRAECRSFHIHHGGSATIAVVDRAGHTFADGDPKDGGLARRQGLILRLHLRCIVRSRLGRGILCI
jgi:hypothetical protein